MILTNYEIDSLDTFYNFVNVRPLGENSLVRTSLPIKHSYLPHKDAGRCRFSN